VNKPKSRWKKVPVPVTISGKLATIKASNSRANRPGVKAASHVFPKRHVHLVFIRHHAAVICQTARAAQVKSIRVIGRPKLLKNPKLNQESSLRISAFLN